MRTIAAEFDLDMESITKRVLTAAEGTYSKVQYDNHPDTVFLTKNENDVPETLPDIIDPRSLQELQTRLTKNGVFDIYNNSHVTGGVMQLNSMMQPRVGGVKEILLLGRDNAHGLLLQIQAGPPVSLAVERPDLITKFNIREMDKDNPGNDDMLEQGGHFWMYVRKPDFKSDPNKSEIERGQGIHISYPERPTFDLIEGGAGIHNVNVLPEGVISKFSNEADFPKDKIITSTADATDKDSLYFMSDSSYAAEVELREVKALLGGMVELILLADEYMESVNNARNVTDWAANVRSILNDLQVTMGRLDTDQSRLLEVVNFIENGDFDDARLIIDEFGRDEDQRNLKEAKGVLLALHKSLYPNSDTFNSFSERIVEVDSIENLDEGGLIQDLPDISSRNGSLKMSPMRTVINRIGAARIYGETYALKKAKFITAREVLKAIVRASNLSNELQTFIEALDLDFEGDLSESLGHITQFGKKPEFEGAVYQKLFKELWRAAMLILGPKKHSKMDEAIIMLEAAQAGMIRSVLEDKLKQLENKMSKDGAGDTQWPDLSTDSQPRVIKMFKAMVDVTPDYYKSTVNDEPWLELSTITEVALDDMHQFIFEILMVQRNAYVRKVGEWGYYDSEGKLDSEDSKLKSGFLLAEALIDVFEEIVEGNMEAGQTRAALYSNTAASPMTIEDIVEMDITDRALVISAFSQLDELFATLKDYLINGSYDRTEVSNLNKIIEFLEEVKYTIFNPNKEAIFTDMLFNFTFKKQNIERNDEENMNAIKIRIEQRKGFIEDFNDTSRIDVTIYLLLKALEHGGVDVSELVESLGVESVDDLLQDIQFNEEGANKIVSSPIGGIDLNPNEINMQLRKEGKGVVMPVFLPEQVYQLQNTIGFLPVIINIAPVLSLPLLLGLSDEPGEENQDISYNISQDFFILPKRFELAASVHS